MKNNHKTIKYYSRSFLAISAIALGLSAGGNALAAPDGRPLPGEGPAAARLEKLHTELKLNAEQDALWKKASAAMEESWKNQRARHQSLREQAQKTLAAPSPDLRALATEQDKIHAAAEADRKVVRDQWLALYDKLDAGQKSTAAKFLAQRLERGHGHHRHHRGGAQDKPAA